jgi:hypothetical protein
MALGLLFMRKLCVKYLFIFLFLGYNTVYAQLEKNVQLEVLGRPSWQMLIPLEENGLILLVKTDLTKVTVFRFNKDLEKLWEKEVYLDVEKAPKAYTLANNHISLLFSETSGMYYQVFKVDLSTGVIDQDGFELREFFMEHDYVFLGDKVLMAGSNAKGAAFFQHSFKQDEGRLIKSESILGQVAVNLFEYLPDNNTIESLWSVKTKGYANESKKKGEFIKDAFIVHAILDTAGVIISKTEIKQSGGKFPLDAKLLRLSGGSKVIVGSYKSNLGDKGIYVYPLNTNAKMKTYSFSSLLSGRNSLSVEDLQQIIGNYSFLANQPLEGDHTIIFGGVFVKPQFQTVTQQDRGNLYNSGYGRSRYNGFSNLGNQRRNSTSREIFRGYHYPTGFVMELSIDGELLMVNRIDINNLTSEVQQALAYNQKGAVSYCLKGDLAANNFNIGTKPLLYKLSEENKDPLLVRNLAFIPAYNEVKFWYSNYFIAEGSKTKIEAVSVNDNISEDGNTKRKGLFGRKKKKTPASYSQIRKTIYLTKIASGG